MTIYLDVVFVENIFMDYIILITTAIIIKSKQSSSKILLSSIIGAIYSIIVFLVNLNTLFSIISKIFVSILMIKIAFMSNSFKKIFKEVIIFYLVSITFGGAALMLMYFVRPKQAIIKNGLFIGMYSMKIIFLGAIVGFALITIAFKIVKSRINRDNLFCNLEICIKNKKTVIRALLDTGNLLREPITGKPVIIVEKDSLKEIVDEDILENINSIIDGTYNCKQLETVLKIIPYNSIGNENGLMVGIKSDYVEVYTDEKIILKDIIIGIYSNKLSKNNLYSGLLGLEILEGGVSKNGYIESFEN